MTEERIGSLLDICFTLKNGRDIAIKGVMIKVYDAFRKMKAEEGSFDKRFIWGDGAGVDVDDISAWHVINQYDE